MQMVDSISQVMGSRSPERRQFGLPSRTGPGLARLVINHEVLEQCERIVRAYTSSIGRPCFCAPYDLLC
jgi:hypothetical protein